MEDNANNSPETQGAGGDVPVVHAKGDIEPEIQESRPDKTPAQEPDKVELNNKGTQEANQDASPGDEDNTTSKEQNKEAAKDAESNVTVAEQPAAQTHVETVRSGDLSTRPTVVPPKSQRFNG